MRWTLSTALVCVQDNDCMTTSYLSSHINWNSVLNWTKLYGTNKGGVSMCSCTCRGWGVVRLANQLLHTLIMVQPLATTLRRISSQILVEFISNRLISDYLWLYVLSHWELSFQLSPWMRPYHQFVIHAYDYLMLSPHQDLPATKLMRFQKHDWINQKLRKQNKVK